MGSHEGWEGLACQWQHSAPLCTPWAEQGEPGGSRFFVFFFFFQPTCTGLTPGELHFGANSPDLSGFTSGTPLLTSATLRAANAHSPDPHPTSSTSSAILARLLCSLQTFVLPSPPGADYPARGRALHSSEGAESHVDQVSVKH